MRDTRINVFYYPDMWVDGATLKKAILLFDELHFMDRPAFSFSNNFGSIGAQADLRRFEASFRGNGVPLFVHDAPGGRVDGEFLEQIKADIDDPQFLKRFHKGLQTSANFRKLFVPEGNYGGDREEDVSQKLIDLPAALETYETPSTLFFDKKVSPFDFSTELGRAKKVITDAALCSAKLNFALKINAQDGLVPIFETAS